MRDDSESPVKCTRLWPAIGSIWELWKSRVRGTILEGSGVYS